MHRGLAATALSSGLAHRLLLPALALPWGRHWREWFARPQDQFAAEAYADKRYLVLPRAPAAGCGDLLILAVRRTILLLAHASKDLTRQRQQANAHARRCRRWLALPVASNRPR